MSKKLCIIPARGGSKRIPRKNIKYFLGKPIIAYSIEVAIKSDLFDEVMVSTDNEEIAEIAKTYGAKVPFLRSIKNADDFSTTVDVLLEVIKIYEKKGKKFTQACCIYPTAPFVTQDTLKEGYEKLISGNCSSVFPVVAFNYPIWRGLRNLDNGEINLIWPEHLNSRSQDLEEVYHDAGQWYWFNIASLKSKKRLFTNGAISVIMSPLEVQDIDNQSDWIIAEMKYEYLQSIK
jgi:pseudaminic acid cytidylyltransferase